MLKIEGKKREAKASVDTKSQVIGVVYGGDVKENILVILDYNKFNKIFIEAGTSQIISLNIEGEEYDVLVKEFQLNPVTDRFTHIDFYAITKGQEMEVNIPFEFIGESPAVKSGNVLNKVHTDIKVICLPKDIPAHIEIDLSVLETIQDSVRLEDIKLGDGVRFVSENMADVIVSVSAPVEEIEEEVIAENTEESSSVEEKKEEEKKD
jgi:large subunit ribosomal protein L25